MDRGTPYYRASAVMAIPSSAAPIIVYPLNQIGLNKIEQDLQGHRDAGHRIVIPCFHRGDGQVMGSRCRIEWPWP